MKGEERISIVYHFKFSDEHQKTYTVELDEKTLRIVSCYDDSLLTDWARLENKKCSHCPLDPQNHVFCPVAANLWRVVESFKDQFSDEKTTVTVLTKERAYIKKAQLQNGIFGIFGLIMATSGCPYMDFLRPMARFHLPFSSVQETLVRTVSFYLLRQYFVAKRNGTPDFELKCLGDHYEKVKEVNEGIIIRIRAIAQKDANSSAVIILNCFADLLTSELSKDFSSLEFLFDYQNQV